MGETMHEQRFSKLQLELLSLYNRDISDEELIQIRGMLARFFAKRATQKANAVWDEKNLDAGTILRKHRRRSSGIQ
jgi:hypothetical protein